MEGVICVKRLVPMSHACHIGTVCCSCQSLQLKLLRRFVLVLIIHGRLKQLRHMLLWLGVLPVTSGQTATFDQFPNALQGDKGFHTGGLLYGTSYMAGSVS